MIFGLAIGELRVLCNVEAFFISMYLTRERISDLTGIGLLAFRHDILHTKMYSKTQIGRV